MSSDVVCPGLAGAVRPEWAASLAFGVLQYFLRLDFPVRTIASRSPVGNHVDPVTEMRGTDGCRWYTVPLCVIPARGQVSEYVAKPPNKEPWDVLQQHPSGS